MKGGFWKRILLASLVLTATAGAYAQSNAVSKSVTIQIVAYVPPVLNLSLDFSRNSAILLIGYLPGEEANNSDIGHSGSGGRFEIRRGATIELGNARLFSNLITSYSVKVYSSNGGKLKSSADAGQELIPYQLRFGNSLASAVGGSFTFAAAGKSSYSSEPRGVALEIGDVPVSATNGFYTDQLMFSVSAN